MKAFRWLLLAAACALPAVAGAQWQWLDKDGRKVFSDRPPPSDIAPNRILKQPGQRAAAVEAAAPATAASAPVPQIATKDKALEEKKKQVEAADAAKRKEAEDQQAKVRAENCSRAKEAKANFDSGVRIAPYALPITPSVSSSTAEAANFASPYHAFHCSAVL